MVVDGNVGKTSVELVLVVVVGGGGGGTSEVVGVTGNSVVVEEVVGTVLLGMAVMASQSTPSN